MPVAPADPPWGRDNLGVADLAAHVVTDGVSNTVADRVRNAVADRMGHLVADGMCHLPLVVLGHLAALLPHRLVALGSGGPVLVLGVGLPLAEVRVGNGGDAGEEVASLANDRRRLVDVGVDSAALGGNEILALLNVGCLNDGLVLVVALLGELVVALLLVLVVALLSVLLMALLGLLGVAGRDLAVVLHDVAPHAAPVVLLLPLLLLPVPVDVTVHSKGADKGQGQSQSEAHLERVRISSHLRKR